jgi:hypothetical protein
MWDLEKKYLKKQVDNIKSDILEEVNSQLSAMLQYLYPEIYALKNKLALKTDPIVIAVQGDSTGNNIDEWFYLFGQWLASKYPEYTIKHVLWGDTTQSYDDTSVISLGSSGKGYVLYTNEDNDHVIIRNADRLNITGDIDLRIHCNADDWASGAVQVLINKLGSGDARAFTFYINTDGRLRFYWSPDGTATALKGVYSTTAIASDNGTDLWLRCTVDVDNGDSGHTVKFFTSLDGDTWTQLGNDVVGAGTTSLFANAEGVDIGSGSLGKFYGKIYYAEIRNGIDGTVVASPDFGMLPPMYSAISGITAYDIQGNIINREGYSGGMTWGHGSPTIVMLNASVSGAKLTYSTDPTRFALQLAKEPDINFISYSHNEGSTLDYRTDYLAYCDQLRTKWPSTAIVPITQNLQTSATGNYLYHNRRCKQIAQLAAARRYLCIDIHTLMTESGNLASYVAEDGVHPTEAGSQFWADCISDVFDLIL